MKESLDSKPRRDRLMAIGFTLILWILLMVPGDSVQELPGPFDFLIPPHADKLGHCLLFALECVFLGRWFRHLPASFFASGVVATQVSAGTLAVVTEAAQAWIPQRLADPWDVLADLAGIALWTLGVKLFGGEILGGEALRGGHL